MTNNNLKNFISIEGNIGSGKSTFIRKLSESINAEIVFEPVERWQDINGHNILNEFYKDMKRWAYSFQSYVFLTRIQEVEKKLKEKNNELFFCERSTFTDRYAFAKNCHQIGFINDLEWNMYCSWFNWMTDNHMPLPCGFIYLRVSPEVAYKRINIRGRSEEKSISKDYLELLHKCHEDWLIHRKDVSNYVKNIPILIIDCNEEFEYNNEIWNEITKKVINFINETQLKNNLKCKDRGINDQKNFLQI